MPDKTGSSSYSAGDAGGSCGDYHGVSRDWVRNKAKSGGMKASKSRLDKFHSNIMSTYHKGVNKGNISIAEKVSSASVGATTGFRNKKNRLKVKRGKVRLKR